MRDRRRALARRATGRVLDLGGADSHRSLWVRSEVDATILDGADDDRLLGLVDRDRRFDVVFCVFGLVATRDLAGTLSRITRVLAHDGHVLFLEPARRRGPVGRAQRVASPAIQLTTGWRMGRDAPAELRAAGLSVTDLERHRAPTVQWWLSELVVGVAHHELRPAATAR